ncbi:MAG: CAP domain-containing protein, partial [Acidimicrobiia bacterium]
MGGKVQIVQRRLGGWRKVSAVLATVTALVAGGLVGSGGVLLGPIQPAGAAVPFPTLPANATWLQTVNAWRAASGLAAVTESTATTPTWSEGALKHSTYIVETGDLAHAENPLNTPWYSVEGNDAGINGNVAASIDATKTDRKFVEQWITAPFHAAGVLDPTLQTTGFGSYRKVGATPHPAAATLDVIRGRTGPAPTNPTFFPGDDSTLPVGQQAYHGGESPDPLSHCPGYNPGGGAAINTGTPLFVLMPKAPDLAVATTAVVKRNGVAVESCTYDENTYTNPVAGDQTTARGVMASRHQVVVIPRLPLAQGSVYTVDVTVRYA